MSNLGDLRSTVGGSADAVGGFIWDIEAETTVGVGVGARCSAVFHDDTSMCLVY